MSYSSVVGHHSMVFDDQRNEFYKKAIIDAVDSQSIVLDLGAGLGLHGLIAAKAGASKVYLLEPTSVIEALPDVIKENELVDCVEIINKSIEESRIPQAVDIIISVFTGNFLLTEDLLPSLFYARDKYLTPNGRLIPDRAKMEVVPVSAPEYYEKHIKRWDITSQDIDYSALHKYASNYIYYDNQLGMKSVQLSESVEILDLDFMTASKADCHNQVEVKINKYGVCHGWLGWFNTRLGDQWLSTSPDEPETHWRQALLPVDPPIVVNEGDVMLFELDRPEFGQWTWTVTHGEHSQRHSTFFSEPVTPSLLIKVSDQYKAKLNAKGEIAVGILKKLDGNVSTEKIAKEIFEEHRDLFPELKIAKNFVIELVKQFS